MGHHVRTRRGREPRPRYDRVAALIVATTVLAVSLVGGLGMIPISAADAGADLARAATKPTASETASPSATPSATQTANVTTSRARLPKLSSPPEPTAIPADSGAGRRIVFSIQQQRVWLVDADGASQRTYLVSGSLTNNLQPGSYAVYSRSRYAVGVDDSGTMEYFVRFTRGANAAIGFHTIPVLDGQPVQTTAQLGTPQSHGCIRQETDDAIVLWDFAPIGTRVVVVA